MTAPKPLIAGNWKMNGLAAASAELEAMLAGLAARDSSADALICPPATLLFGFAERARSAAESGAPIAIGGQDCHAKDSGAHTGDLSAAMLADAGATAVLVGHSERRQDHGETDEQVRAKAEAALRAGLTPIVCLGESAEDREAGKAVDVILSQLAASMPQSDAGAPPGDVAIAYEPVWAIGSGRTPSAAEIEEAHAALRRALEQRLGAKGAGVRLLYGGSVKPGNAAEILALKNVDGALVGGASLKAQDFLAIYDAAPDR